MSKQTALEQLYEKIENQDMGEVPMYVYDFIEQAKQMEKEQIIDAYDDANGSENKEDGSPMWGEDYYNETYGSEGSHKSSNNSDTSSQTEISDEEIEKQPSEKYLNLFLKWILMNYSTVTTNGIIFEWVDIVGNKVSTKKIANHYKKLKQKK